jgi:CheY-like chemotaxis protein
MAGPPITAPELSGLAGQRIATLGFDPERGEALARLFGAAGAFCRTLPSSAAEAGECACDGAVVWLETWLPPPAGTPLPKVLIAVVTPQLLGRYAGWVQSVCADCVFWPCSGEELVFRVAWALGKRRAPCKPAPDRPFRVLVADDDPSITALLKAVLEGEGMVCRTLPNGAAALEAARQGGAGLLLLDIHMPGMDGYQVLAALKGDDTTRSLPVVMLTACDQESEIVRGFGLGAEDYIVKPFNPLEVFMRVKRIAERAV